MALINLPPRQQESPGSYLPDCCTADPSARAALFCYLLTLLLKKVGTEDWTDCDTSLDVVSQFTSYDESHVEVLEGQVLSALLTANGVTVNAAAANAFANCLKNNAPPWSLKAYQFFLWNLIVNELTP